MNILMIGPDSGKIMMKLLNCFLKNINFKDVPKYLNAADIGIILRDEV